MIEIWKLNPRRTVNIINQTVYPARVTHASSLQKKSGGNNSRRASYKSHGMQLVSGQNLKTQAAAAPEQKSNKSCARMYKHVIGLRSNEGKKLEILSNSLCIKVLLFPCRQQMGRSFKGQCLHTWWQLMPQVPQYLFCSSPKTNCNCLGGFGCESRFSRSHCDPRAAAEATSSATSDAECWERGGVQTESGVLRNTGVSSTGRWSMQSLGIDKCTHEVHNSHSFYIKKTIQTTADGNKILTRLKGYWTGHKSRGLYTWASHDALCPWLVPAAFRSTRTCSTARSGSCKPLRRKRRGTHKPLDQFFWVTLQPNYPPESSKWNKAMVAKATGTFVPITRIKPVLLQHVRL